MDCNRKQELEMELEKVNLLMKELALRKQQLEQELNQKKLILHVEGSAHASTSNSLTDIHRSRTSEIIREQEYQKLPSRADTRGQNFEIKMALLLFLRGINSTQKFLLASNVAGVGQFDDLVFMYTDVEQQIFRILLIQLKHKQKVVSAKNASISRDLLSLKGHFSVPQLCRSFPQVTTWITNHGSIDYAELILFTNKELHTTSECYPNNLLSTGGRVFNFNEKQNTEIYTLFQELEIYNNLLHEKDPNSFSQRVHELEEGIENIDIKSKLQELRSDCSKFKLEKEKKDLGDITCYRHFLKHFKVYASQSDESGLNEFIKDEIQQACGTINTDADVIFDTLFKEIHNWWENENFYLSDNAQFWNDLIQSRFDKLNQPMLKELTELGLKFNEEHTELLSEAINKNTIVQIVPNNSNCVLLSCLKVHNSLSVRRHLLVDGKTLKLYWNEVLILWRKWCNFLIVAEGVNMDMNILMEILQKNPHKRLIVIAGTLNRKIPHFKFHDNITMKEFNRVSQTHVLTSVVKFQGYDVPLGSVIDSDDSISPDIIVQVVKEKLVLGEPLTSDILFYIPRTLKLAYEVSNEVLSHYGVDSESFTLAVSGLPQAELQKLLPPGRKVQSIDSNSENKGFCEIIAISTDNDFLKLTEIHDTVHWLHWEKNVLMWKESRGDMRALLKYLSNEPVVFENVNSIADVPHRVVLVSAEPGMGKSTLLTHLALGMKRKRPSVWVLRVNLNDFTQKLEMLPLNLQAEHVVEFLLEVSGITEEWKPAFRNKLSSAEDVCILFDGYDEVSPKYTDKLTLMFRYLERMKLQKLWVTTRPIFRELLEKKLSTLNFTLQPFSELDQRNFLFKFWKANMPHLKSFVVHNFITELLQLTERNFNDRDRQFTGIPLQSMLLAEAFEENMRRYSETGEVGLPQHFDLLHLYKKFVNRKLDIYYEKNKVDLTKPGLVEDYTNVRKVFEKDHMISALFVLLPQTDIVFEEKESVGTKLISFVRSKNKQLTNVNINASTATRYAVFISKVVNGSEKTGIIKNIVNEKPVFIHRTFAEYFAALWFSRNYKQVKQYLENNIFSSNFQIVRSFIDRMLAQKFELHVAVLNQDKDSVEAMLLANERDVNTCDEGGRTALHLAVMNLIDIADDDDHFSDILSIVCMLLEHGANPSVKDKVLNWRPLRLADRINAHPTILGMLLEKHIENSDLILIKERIRDLIYIQDVLRVATAHGFVQLIAFVLSNGISLEHPILVIHEDYRCTGTMLHAAVSHGKLQLVEFLLKQKVNIEAKDTVFLRTALMIAAAIGELQIVKLLIKVGANVNASDCSGRNALMIAAEKGEFDVVMYLKYCHADLTMCDEYGNNALHWAAMSGNVDIVTFLLESGVDVNSHNNGQLTPLWCAVDTGQLQVVKILRECNTDLHHPNSYGYTQMQSKTLSTLCKIADVDISITFRGVAL